MKKTLACALMLTVIFMLAACGAEDLWRDAKYTRDTELGEGDKTIRVVVSAGGESVTFTLHTDKETLADAMLEQGLLDGDKDIYGIYVKSVNGIFADYDVDGSYWAIKQDGEYMMSGADFVYIRDGDTYEFLREKMGI